MEQASYRLLASKAPTAMVAHSPCTAAAQIQMRRRLISLPGRQVTGSRKLPVCNLKVRKQEISVLPWADQVRRNGKLASDKTAPVHKEPPTGRFIWFFLVQSRARSFN